MWELHPLSVEACASLLTALPVECVHKRHSQTKKQKNLQQLSCTAVNSPLFPHVIFKIICFNQTSTILGRVPLPTGVEVVGER